MANIQTFNNWENLQSVRSKLNNNAINLNNELWSLQNEVVKEIEDWDNTEAVKIATNKYKINITPWVWLWDVLSGADNTFTWENTFAWQINTSQIEWVSSDWVVGYWSWFWQTDNITVKDMSPNTNNNWTPTGYGFNNGTVSWGVTIENEAIKSDWVLWVSIISSNTYTYNTESSDYAISVWIKPETTWLNFNTVFWLSLFNLELCLSIRDNWEILWWSKWIAGGWPVFNDFYNWEYHNVILQYYQNIWWWTLAKVFVNNIYLWETSLDRTTPISWTVNFELFRTFTWYNTTYKWEIKNACFYEKELTADERTLIYETWPNNYTPVW
jgi:hypothetical protein